MGSKKNNLGSLAEFTTKPVFQLAIPVRDLTATRVFYCDVLGCAAIRSDTRSIDFNFFGYPLSAQLVDDALERVTDSQTIGPSGAVLPRFGLIIGWEDWHRAVDHLNYIGVGFNAPPQVLAKGLLEEHATFSLQDPGGNCLEFKAFRNATDFLMT